MLWPTPSPTKLSKAAAAVGTLLDSPPTTTTTSTTTSTTTASTDLAGSDSFDIDFENTDVSSTFILSNSFDNCRPSSPAISQLQHQPLQSALAVDLDNLGSKDQQEGSSVLRTPPESPVKGHERIPLHCPTYAQEQEQQQQQQQQQRQNQTSTLTQPHQSFDLNTNFSISLSSPPSSPTLIQPPTALPPKLSQSLSAHPLFKDCTESGIQLLASRMHIRHYHPQDHIIHRSEQSSAMFYVLRGTVKVVSHDNEATYYEIKENNFFGDVGVLYRVPRTMDVLAKNRCTIAILSGDDLVKAMEQSPEMAKAIGYQTQERYQMYLKRRQSVSARRTLDGGTGGPDEYQDDSKSESFAKCDVHSAIRKVPLFQSCPSEVIHLLSLNVEPRTYNLGQSIIHRGEIGREMFFIASGTVEILSDDNLRVLARFRDGQFFGEIAVLLDVPRIANVKAVSEVEVFVLTKDNLEAVFKAVPGAAETITSEGHRLYQNWLDATSRSQSVDQVDTTVTDSQNAEVKSTSNEVATPTCTDHAPQMLQMRRRSSEAIIHPIEAGHPEAISVLPLTCTTDFKRGRRTSYSQSSAVPVQWMDTQEDTVQDAPPISFFNQDAGAEEAQEPPTSRNPTIRGLQASNPRRRRASVAVWSQQDLMKLAEAAQAKSSIDTTHATVQATSLAQSLQPEESEHAAQEPAVGMLSKESRHPSFSSLALHHPKKLMGPATFQDLDDNIVSQILGALPIGPLLIARRVCRSWNTLIMESENVLTDLDLSTHKKTVSDTAIASLCSSVLSRKLQRTVSVSLRDCFLISDKGLAMLVAHIPGVRSLDLHSCWNVTDAGFRTLGVYCPQLRSVDFSNCRKLGDETIFGLYPKESVELAIRSKEQLVEAVLRPRADSYPILWDTVATAGSPDTSMDQTQVLLTRRSSIDMDSDGQGQVQVAPNDPSPLVMDVVMTEELETPHFKAPAKIAPSQTGPRGCPLLSHLNLSYCKNLTDKSFVHLSLYGSKQLVSLNLQRCTTISPEAFVSLDMDAKKAVSESASAGSDSMSAGYNPLTQPCFPKLRELYLSDCTFLTDAAIFALAPNMPAVQVLSLSFCCALTDLAIEALLDSCAFLHKLDLSFCGSAVSDASLYQLAQLDAQEPGQCSLEELEIRGCVRVTEHGIREIIDGCPNLKRLNVSGCSGIGGALSANVSPAAQTPIFTLGQAIDSMTVDMAAQCANGIGPLDMPAGNDAWGSGDHVDVGATDNGSSGSLAVPAHGAHLARKMDALKRGKEWVLAQQRPGLAIIV